MQIDKSYVSSYYTGGVGRGGGCVLVHVCLFHDSQELSLANLSITILISFINHLLYIYTFVGTHTRIDDNNKLERNTETYLDTISTKCVLTSQVTLPF